MLKSESLLLFDAAGVMRCVRHTLAAKDWRPLFDGSGRAPGLHLVHDHGVYLMSNGFPRDAPDATSSSFVVYAELCDPSCDADWWDTSRALVGGDDFVDFVGVSADWLPQLAKSDKLYVVVSPDELVVTFSPPPAVAASVASEA